MPRGLVVFVVACGPWLLGSIQAAEAPRSAACRQALQALDAWDAAASAGSAPPRSQREVLRRRAAQDCLGGPADAPLQRPQSVAAPDRPRPALQTRPLPVPSPTPAPVAAPRTPTALTSCDATGCWASDGSRVQRMGPTLVGPQGVCTLTAGVLHCP